MPSLVRCTIHQNRKVTVLLDRKGIRFLYWLWLILRYRTIITGKDLDSFRQAILKTPEKEKCIIYRVSRRVSGQGRTPHYFVNASDLDSIATLPPEIRQIIEELKTSKEQEAEVEDC